MVHANPYVLSGGDPSRIEALAQYLDNPVPIWSRRKHFTVHGYYKGVPITAFNTGMGPGSVSATLPEIIEACASPDMVFLRLGTSGALQSYLNVGDLVVTEDVEKHESTSDKIVGPGAIAVADANVMAALAIGANSVKHGFQTVYSGRTVVTDELYWFNKQLKEKKDHGNNLAVSMEFSAYCAERDAYNREFGYNIQTGEILTISDIVVPHEHRDRIDFEERQPLIEASLLLAGLEAIVAIDKLRKK
ncbi:MAG: nucleoside phosphorylase [Nanoarchaeota archaeon]|nr:nucleoside phosphorylase [Nanoarchaeota archaeon]